MSTMNSPVNVTEGRKTSVLTARTASGSGGSQPNRPLLLAPGSIQMQERLPGPCPGKGVDWLHRILSSQVVSFNGYVEFELERFVPAAQ